MKLLCVCPIGIGNYLLMYPACALIKKEHPDWELHLLGLRKGIEEFAERDPLWSGITVFDPTKIKGLYARIRIVQAVRGNHFDASLNFFPSNKWLYNVLPFLAGIPKRFGYTYPYMPFEKLGFLTNNRISADPALHDMNQNIALAQKVLGTPSDSQVPLSFPKLFSDEDALWAQEFLTCTGKQTLLAIHPGSSAEHRMILKRWEPGKFAELADHICKKIGAEALVFGGNDEADLKETVSKNMQCTCHEVGQVSLSKTAALLSSCALSLCNDSGLMHIASCANVPTIAIFGPTDENRNGPVGKKHLVVRHPLDGFPLWKSENVGNRSSAPDIDPQASLKALSAQEAWEKTLPWLEAVGI